MMIPSRTRSVTMNGATPRKIVAKLTSSTAGLDDEHVHPDRRVDQAQFDRHDDDDAEPDRIETERAITGKMIGTVRMIIAIASIRQPSTRYITMISSSTP